MRQLRSDLPLDLGTNANRTPEPMYCDHVFVYPFAGPGYCWVCGEGMCEHFEAVRRSQRDPEDPGDGPREGGE